MSESTTGTGPAEESVALNLFEAGFSELVSVIPPGAKLSPGSKVSKGALGKVPGLKGSSGWHGYDWRRHQPTREEIGDWVSWGSNIGLLGTRFPAVDIDVDDEALAALVEEATRDILGPAPIRLSRGPRRLLVYRADDPMGRHRFGFEREGQSYNVELLGRGQQYLVHGRHPAGVPYRWNGRPLWEWSPGELPKIDVVSVERLWDELENRLRDHSPGDAAFRITRTGGRVREVDAPPQEHLTAPSNADLVQLVETLPNTFESRDDYIKFLCAVKAAGAEDEGAAQVAALGWASRWEQGVNDPEDVQRDWDSLKPPFRVGWDWLVQLGEQAGVCSSAEYDFEARADSMPVLPPGIPAGDFSDALSQAGNLKAVPFEDLPQLLPKFAESLASLGSDEEAIARARGNAVLRARFSQDGPALLKRFEVGVAGGPFIMDPSGAPTLGFLSPGDFSTDPPYLVEGRIPLASVGALVGGFSLGKTWLAVDLACSIAFGSPWLGHDVQQRPTILMPAEGNRALHRRLIAWLVHHGQLPPQTSIAEFFDVTKGRLAVVRRPTRFDTPNIEEALRNTIQRMGAGLLVIDTLGKTLGVDQSENDNDVANWITGMLSRIAEETGCTILLVHHVGLSTAGRARGASGWEQGVDFELIVVGSRDALAQGQPVSLQWRKMRDGELPSPVHFRLKPVNGFEVQRFPGLAREPMKGMVVEVDSAARPPGSLEARVFEYVDMHPDCAKEAVRVGTMGRNADIDAALHALQEKGAVEDRGRGNRHRYRAQPGWRVGSTGDVEHPGAEFPMEAQLVAAP